MFTNWLKMGESVLMNLPRVKNIKFANPSRSFATAADSKYLIRNIVGSFLVLVLSVLSVVLLLFPRLDLD